MPNPKAIPDHKWERYVKLRDQGFKLARAADDVGISRGAAYSFERGEEGSSGHHIWLKRKFYATERPLHPDAYSEKARKAIEDFGYFRRRFFGRRSVPWQEDAADKVQRLLASPRREFVVINVAPGTGKSTLFTHDIPAWLTVKDRAMRGLIGSRTQRQANSYLVRLRNTLDRPPGQAVKAPTKELERGIAFDAESTLYEDYGRFRPSKSEQGFWTNEQITIAQLEATLLDEKEPTWAAFGFDSGYLGWRFDFAIWDDLVDSRNSHNAEQRETLAQMWEDIAEARLEPGGLMVLQGQRLAGDDLYRYCLDKVDYELDDEGEPTEGPKMYHHIVYPAHFENDCQGEHHPKKVKPWPAGCLLDPDRLSWRELSVIRNNRAMKYRVIYQQEDTDPSSVLVNPLWVSGGTDPETGAEYPGCWDSDRALCEFDRRVAGDLFSFATADPSPTKMWSVQWWIYAAESEQFFLMDLHNDKLTASEFLDFDPATQSYVGLMEGWQQRSIKLGLPIAYWIVERNAAQRFLLQYIHVRSWQSRHNVEIIGHDTHMNKSDPDYGVQSLAPLWRHGKVRLPGSQRGNSREICQKLVDEVTRWPDGIRDDNVMAQWFGVWQLPNIYSPHHSAARLWTPSWMRRSEEALMAQAGLR